MKQLLALPLLALAGLASAQSTLNYFTNVRAIVDQDSQEIWVENDPNIQEVHVVTGTGSSVARAQIAPGVNSTFVHWDSLNPQTPSQQLIADARTHWTDTVLISDPALDGTVGYFTASLRVFGNSSFNLTGGYASGDVYSDAGIYGFWDSWIGTSTDGGGSFLVGGWFGDWYSDYDGNVYYTGDELNQPMTEVQLEFIYGQPFLLRMNMEAYFDATNPALLEGTVEGTLDFSHTAYWNGMSAIRDGQGNVVNPTFWSQSGVDWRNSVVPEPASLSVLGLGALALLRRSKTRSHP